MKEREKYFNKFNTNYELTGAKSDKLEVTSDRSFSANVKNKENVQ